MSEPLFILAVLGVGFSTLAWLLTRRSQPLPFEVKSPRTECSLLAGYLVLVVVFLTWGIDALEAQVQREPWQMLSMLGAKLVLFVVLPVVLFYTLWNYKIHDLITGSPVKNHLRVAMWMSLVLILFQLAFGRGVSEIRHSGLSLWAVAAGIPFAYAWLLLEVGLVEEFFFRVLLQSRLTAFLRSETAGILLMALLFGLAHAPGLHYRTAVNPRRIGAVPTMVSGNRIFGSHNFRRRDFLGSAVGANKKHSGCDACPRGRRSGPQLG